MFKMMIYHFNNQEIHQWWCIQVNLKQRFKLNALKFESVEFEIKKTLFWVCKDHQKSSLQLEICTNWCNLQSCVWSILMFVKWECLENMFEILKIFVQISSIWCFECLILTFTMISKWCLMSKWCSWMQSIMFCKEIWCKKWQQKYVQTSIWKHH